MVYKAPFKKYFSRDDFIEFARKSSSVKVGGWNSSLPCCCWFARLCHFISYKKGIEKSNIASKYSLRLFILKLVLLYYQRPMITIHSSIPSHPVHPQSLFNHLNGPWIDLSQLPMNTNDYQWLPMTIKDYQRLSKTIKDYHRLSKTIKD